MIMLNLTLRCDAPGCTRSLPAEMPVFHYVLSSSEVNEALSRGGWGPFIVAGQPVNSTHVYCPEHKP